MNRRALLVTAVAFAFGVGADLLIGYSPIPGYGASIGLFGCIVIIVVSKWIGTAFLERPEAALGDEAPPDLQPDLIGDPDHPALIGDPDHPALRRQPPSSTDQGSADG